jgi:hypothetical protein
VESIRGKLIKKTGKIENGNFLEILAFQINGKMKL